MNTLRFLPPSSSSTYTPSLIWLFIHRTSSLYTLKYSLNKSASRSSSNPGYIIFFWGLVPFFFFSNLVLFLAFYSSSRSSSTSDEVYDSVGVNSDLLLSHLLSSLASRISRNSHSNTSNISFSFISNSFISSWENRFRLCKTLWID